MQRKKFAAIGLVICIAILVGSTTVLSWGTGLAVKTDRATYGRGELITISACGGTAGGVAMLQIETRSGHRVWADQDHFDTSGIFQCQLRVPNGWGSGVYIVTLKDLGAGESVTTTFRVTVRRPPPPVNRPPVARAAGARRALVGREVLFVGLGSRDPDGWIVSYAWDFGDGTTALGAKVRHAFSSPGKYTVTLTVTDNDGASDSDSLEVTVKKPPRPPIKWLDDGIEATELGHLINALTEADTTVKVNTTNAVTVSVLLYPGNPYPEVPLPKNSLPTVVDIFVSDPSAITWPIYVERHYDDEEASRLEESLFGIYFYEDEGWQRCRETGVNAALNVAWARMYEDEMTGSLTVIGEAPSATVFELSELSIIPAEIEPGQPVRISVKVTNAGNRSESHEVVLRVDGVVEDTVMATLRAGASTTVSFTVVKSVEGAYSVEVDGLRGRFMVKVPSPPHRPAEFRVRNLGVSPSDVEAGENVTVSVIVSNVGDESGRYIAHVKLDGEVVDSKTLNLGGGESTHVIFEVSSIVEGSHTVEVDGQMGNFTVVPLPAPSRGSLPMSPGYISGIIIVAISVGAIAFVLLRRRLF